MFSISHGLYSCATSSCSANKDYAKDKMENIPISIVLDALSFIALATGAGLVLGSVIPMGSSFIAKQIVSHFLIGLAVFEAAPGIFFISLIICETLSNQIQGKLGSFLK